MKEPFRKKMSVLLSAVILFFILPDINLKTGAEDEVFYIDYAYNNSGITDSEIKSCTSYNIVASNSTTWGNGWYVVNSDITISNRITVSGTANLILCDGCTLDATRGIQVATGKTLNIYAQSEDGDIMGVLNARTSDDKTANAGIGGNSGKAGGTIVFNGGKITASGSTNGSAGGGAAFGGGRYANANDIKKMKIVVNGGIIKNNALKSVAAIGGGQGGGGGTILINGGTLNLTTYSGAAIGRAYAGSGGYTDITINGGNISAVALTGAPGIGGESASVKINGGTITAYSGGTNNAILGKTVSFGSNMVARAGTAISFDESLPCFDYVQSTTNRKYVALWEHIHTLSYELDENIFSIHCTEDNCNLIDNHLNLTLSTDDDKTYDGIACNSPSSVWDGTAHDVSGEIKNLTGMDLIVNAIELYREEEKIDENSANAGTYTARQTVTLGDTPYTLEKSFHIFPKTIGIEWSDTTFSYDGSEHVPTATAAELIGSDSCEVTVTGSQSKAGKYTAVAEELSNSNYALPEENTCEFSIVPYYIITIPADVTYSESNSASAVVLAEYDVGESYTLSVAVASENNFKLKADYDDSVLIPYTIMCDDTQLNVDNTEILSVNGKGEKNKTLNFSVDPNQMYAGAYSDTLTFNISLT